MASTPPSTVDSGTILDEIVARVQSDLADTKRRVPLEQLRDRVAARGPTRAFAAALRPGEGRPPRVIAELKRASPSRGLIRADFQVRELAQRLVANGAAALSVLTEPHYFQGSPDYLRTVSEVVAVPALRKDFIVDTYQLYEARAWGADAVLLIAKALTPERFRSLHEQAEGIGLAVLAEIHDSDELDVVLAAGARVVGINSRDLRTFKTDWELTIALLARVPESVVTVAESGIKGPEDMQRLTEAGADAFLVGETLMRAPDPGEALAQLLGRDVAAG